MKVKLVPISEITMMTGPTAAADPSIPQAALGQRPSDAYKNNKKKVKKRVDEGVRVKIYGPHRRLATAIPKMARGRLTFSSYSSRSGSGPIRPRMRSINKFFRVQKFKQVNTRQRLTKIRYINRFRNAGTHHRHHK